MSDAARLAALLHAFGQSQFGARILRFLEKSKIPVRFDVAGEMGKEDAAQFVFSGRQRQIILNSRMSDLDLLCALAHEARHAMQERKGYLVDTPVNAPRHLILTRLTEADAFAYQALFIRHHIKATGEPSFFAPLARNSRDDVFGKIALMTMQRLARSRGRISDTALQRAVFMHVFASPVIITHYDRHAVKELIRQARFYEQHASDSKRLGRDFARAYAAQQKPLEIEWLLEMGALQPQRGKAQNYMKPLKTRLISDPYFVVGGKRNVSQPAMARMDARFQRIFNTCASSQATPATPRPKRRQPGYNK